MNKISSSNDPWPWGFKGPWTLRALHRTNAINKVKEAKRTKNLDVHEFTKVMDDYVWDHGGMYQPPSKEAGTSIGS